MYTFKDLVEITAKLRAEDGCPWDREQTFESLRKYMREEAEEAVQAVDNEDMENLCEELGDVLFAAAAVARYAGIDPEQALQEATDKYISRFACMERSAAEQGRSIAGMRLDEMIQAWNHAKQKLQQDTQEDKNNE